MMECPDRWDDGMGITPVPQLLYSFQVSRPHKDTLNIIGDRSYVEDGTLMIFSDDTMVAAFSPCYWTEVHGQPILPGKQFSDRKARQNASAGRECYEDCCDE